MRRRLPGSSPPKPGNTDQTPPWCVSHPKGLMLSVRVQPKASQARIVGPYGNEVKIAVHAAPEGGAANHELLKLLSKKLHLPKHQLDIVSGAHCRSKTVCVTHSELNPWDVSRKLLE